jgi:undecaprenyl diphosphate synthase
MGGRKKSEIKTAMPQHIAVIMDGNGRWARQRGLPRTAGHQQGAESVRRCVKAAGDLGIKYLTLFGFSSENWNRPPEEVRELMRLLRYYLRSETAELHKNNVRLRFLGDRDGLDPDIVSLMENAEDLTRMNTRMNTRINVSLAINYGGRDELLRAACALAADYHERGVKPDLEGFGEQFGNYLMTAGMPDPDVLIRTSGEKRISNFLLWQCAYAEFVFLDTLWPDFDRGDLETAINEYGQRDRRFGKVESSAVVK